MSTPSGNEQVGSAFLLKIAGLLVGGGTGLTHTVTADQLDLTQKTGNRWLRRLASLRGHTTAFELDFQDDGSEFIGRGGASVEIDPGTGFIVVPGVSELTMSMNMTVEEVSGFDLNQWVYVISNRKDISYSVTANYLDPDTAAGAAIAEVIDSLADDATIGMRATVGSVIVEGDVKVGEWTFDSDADGIQPFSFEAMSQGANTLTTGAADPAVAALMNEFFDPDPGPVEFLTENVDGAGDLVPGATSYAGEGLLTSLEFNVPDESQVTISGELTGNGPLVTELQPAA